jgi:hypothetical protein
MHRSDSANIRRLNDIHNTLPVASARLRIGWNTASWPQPNPLFHSFRIHHLYTPPRAHYSRETIPNDAPRGVTVPHPPPPPSSITKRVSGFCHRYKSHKLTNARVVKSKLFTRQHVAISQFSLQFLIFLKVNKNLKIVILYIYIYVS